MTETLEQHTGYNGSERRNGDRPSYCFEEHARFSERIGKVEAEVQVIRSEFMGVKDQVFIMQSMMTKLGETNSALNVRLTEVTGKIEVMTGAIDNLKEVLNVRRAFLPELAKMVLTTGGILGMAWGLFKVLHEILK